jgi:hypothetical protein
MAEVVPVIELLRPLLVTKPAGFRKANLEAALHQFRCDGNASRARADDADISGHRRQVLVALQVKKHN